MRLRSTFLLLLLVAIGADAEASASSAATDVRLDTTKAAVFLTTDVDETHDFILITFHNNTVWPLAVRASGTYPVDPEMPVERSGLPPTYCLAGDPEIRVQYHITRFDTNGATDGQTWCTAEEVWVAPGRSIRFQVDRSRLGTLGMVEVEFSYSWEGDARQVLHSVRTRWLTRELPAEHASN